MSADSAALFAEAMRHLVGEGVARDLSRARELLRAALAAGSGEAGLFEAALAAGGAGAPPDWRSALAILDSLAAREPAADRQRDLLARMNLDAEGFPAARPAVEPIGKAPAVFRAPRLLSPDECAHIAQSAADLLEPTTVYDPVTGVRKVHPVRTSSGATIGPTRQDVVITAILKRVAMVTGTRFECGEPLSLLHYAPGQQYRPHVDTIPNATNQRSHTVLLYLNEGYNGGETRFAASGLTVAGRGGDAVFFANTGPDGEPDPATSHEGLRVTAGAKWLATRWIRQGPYDPWSYANE